MERGLFHGYPAERWIHLRTTNPIESSIAPVRCRRRVAKGLGFRTAGIAVASRSLSPRRLGGRGQRTHLAVLVRAGALFEGGRLVERPAIPEAISEPRGQGGHGRTQPCRVGR